MRNVRIVVKSREIGGPGGGTEQDGAQVLGCTFLDLAKLCRLRCPFPATLGRPHSLQRTARISEGDSVGDSIHGKPSLVYRFEKKKKRYRNNKISKSAEGKGISKPF